MNHPWRLPTIPFPCSFGTARSFGQNVSGHWAKPRFIGESFTAWFNYGVRTHSLDNVIRVLSARFLHLHAPRFPNPRWKDPAGLEMDWRTWLAQWTWGFPLHNFGDPYNDATCWSNTSLVKIKDTGVPWGTAAWASGLTDVFDAGNPAHRVTGRYRSGNTIPLALACWERLTPYTPSAPVAIDFAKVGPWPTSLLENLIAGQPLLGTADEKSGFNAWLAGIGWPGGSGNLHWDAQRGVGNYL